MHNDLLSLADHFRPLNSMLCDLSAKADEAWPEGGMVWSVKNCHGTAHTIKIDDSYLARSKGAEKITKLQDHLFLWAKLIWRAHGTSGKLMDISGESEWDAEENCLIAEHYEQAQQVIALFQASGASIVDMSFIDDLNLSVKCVSLVENNALICDIFWSFD